MKGFLPVCEHVRIQHALPCALVRAVFALEGLLASVRPHVRLQLAPLLEPVQAVFANEGLLTRANVGHQVTLLGRPVRARVAPIGLLGIVNLPMGPQLDPLLEFE